jgi:hypothetical protein
MEPTTEAPVAGQEPKIIEQAEVDKMTPAQISERLDTDLDFAIAITEGRLTIPEPAAAGALPPPPPAAEPPKPPEPPKPGEAPAAAPAAPPPEDKVVQVKES